MFEKGKYLVRLHTYNLVRDLAALCIVVCFVSFQINIFECNLTQNSKAYLFFRLDLPTSSNLKLIVLVVFDQEEIIHFEKVS